MLKKVPQRLVPTTGSLEDFEYYLRVKKGYSDTTIKNTMGQARYIKKTWGLTVTQDLVDQVYDKLRDTRKYNTVRHYLSCLAHLAEWQDVQLNLPHLRRTYEEPKYLDSYELGLLMKACRWQRDLALVYVLAVGGLRRGEACRLNRADLEGYSLTVHKSKSGRSRRVALNKDALDALKAYLANRDDDEPAMFISNTGKRLTLCRMSQVISMLGKRAGIKRRVYCHLLRHSCATNLLNNNCSLVTVMTQLGHASLASTVIYSHHVNYDEQARQIKKVIL